MWLKVQELRSSKQQCLRWQKSNLKQISWRFSLIGSVDEKKCDICTCQVVQKLVERKEPSNWENQQMLMLNLGAINPHGSSLSTTIIHKARPPTPTTCCHWWQHPTLSLRTVSCVSVPLADTHSRCHVAVSNVATNEQWNHRLSSIGEHPYPNPSNPS